MKINAKVLQQLIKEDLNLDAVLEYRFHPVRRWRIDVAIPSLSIAIELEGGIWTNGRHTRGKGFLGDVEKYNNLSIFKWRLLRYTHSNHNYSDIINDLKEYIKNNG